MANPETAAIIGGVLARKAGEGGTAGFDIDIDKSSSAMAEFMNMMRLSDMLKMMGDIPTEQKVAINDQLIKIKK